MALDHAAVPSSRLAFVLVPLFAAHCTGHEHVPNALAPSQPRVLGGRVRHRGRPARCTVLSHTNPSIPCPARPPPFMASGGLFPTGLWVPEMVDCSDALG